MTSTRAAVCATVLFAVLTGCAAPPAAYTLDDVIDERSRSATDQWVRAAMAAEQYIEREWPDAVSPPLRFDRWVEPERHAEEVLQCMNLATGRTTGSLIAGALVLAPRPTKEPNWMLPVAHLRCSMQIVPWRGGAPPGGAAEQAWVLHQVTVALPACVRRWGGDLIIADLDAAIDASLYPTTHSGSRPHDAHDLEPTQSVWAIAELRNVDDATAHRIRAACPDPGRTLSRLSPPEIRG